MGQSALFLWYDSSTNDNNRKEYFAEKNQATVECTIVSASYKRSNSISASYDYDEDGQKYYYMAIGVA